MQANYMISEMDGSVLAIVERSSGSAIHLLGTGIAVAPNVVLTCAHVFKNKLIRNEKTLLPEAEVCLGSKGIKPDYIRAEEKLDLCSVHFNFPPGLKPIQFFRSARLQGSRITAAGYVPDSPSRHVTRDLVVIHDLRVEDTPWVRFGQLQGGLPHGFSGGPVIIGTKKGLRPVGMLQLGSETSATSRFIGADLIVSFLARQGVHVAMGELKQKDIMKKERTDHPERSTEINNSIIVGGASYIRGSIINNQNTSHPGGLDDRDWENLKKQYSRKKSTKPRTSPQI
jgi:hypothetical protein